MEHETIHTNGRERNVTFSTDETDTYIDIELTGKEAVDVLNALQELKEHVDNDTVDTDLPVTDTYLTVLGGMSFPHTYQLLISSEAEFETVRTAIEQYTPDETGTDFSDRVLNDVQLAIESTDVFTVPARTP